MWKLREDISIEIRGNYDVEFPRLSEKFIDHTIDDLFRVFDTLGFPSFLVIDLTTACAEKSICYGEDVTFMDDGDYCAALFGSLGC